MEYKDATDVVAGLHNALDKVDARIRRSRLSRAFWHSVNVKWYTPPVLVATSWELDYPYRKSRTVVLRYWWNRSAVLGFWGKTEYDEDTALLEATIHGRERTHEERSAYNEATAWSGDPESEGFGSGVLSGRPGLRDGTTRHAWTDVVELR